MQCRYLACLPPSRAYPRAYRKLTLASCSEFWPSQRPFKSFRHPSGLSVVDQRSVTMKGLFFGARRAVAYPSDPMIRPNICTQAPIRPKVWHELSTPQYKETPLHAIDSIITLALLSNACHVCKLPLSFRLHWMPRISMTSHHLSHSNRSLASFARFDSLRPLYCPYHAHIEAQVPFWSPTWSSSGRYR